MTTVSIVGGAGYTAGELIRILRYHPEVRLDSVQSSSHAGLPVSHVHEDLSGECSVLFSDAPKTDADILFLCSGHGRSRSFLTKTTLSPKTKVIDLSSDYRIHPENDGFIYGLPELHKDGIRSAKAVANPGCFATAIQLGLLPLAGQGLLEQEIHVQALTGSTGAGQQPSETTHFSWRANNISVYKAFEHQHLDEIRQSIKQLQPGFDHAVNFIPVRGDFTRGIFASMYTECRLTEQDARDLYRTYYHDHPFVVVSDRNPTLKWVVNTNKCVLFMEKHGNKLLIISLIDNLLKGASGQAVQNMNLMQGFPETCGLQLKPSVF